MPSSGSVSRNRQRGRPMASRSFDGKVALLFGEERGLTRAPPRGGVVHAQARVGGRGWKKEAEWVVRNRTDGRDWKKLRFPEARAAWSWAERRVRESRIAARKTGSEAASELGFPGCTASGGCALFASAGAVARLVPRLTQSSISQGPAAGVSGGRARASHRVRRPRRPPRLLGPLGLRLSCPFLLRRPLPPRSTAQSTWRRCCSRSWSARSWTSCLSPSRTNLRSFLLTSSPRSTAWRGGTRNLRWRAVSAALFPPWFLGPTPQRWLVSPCKLAVPTTSLVASLLRLGGHRRPSLNYPPSRFDTKELFCF